MSNYTIFKCKKMANGLMRDIVIKFCNDCVQVKQIFHSNYADIITNLCKNLTDNVIKLCRYDIIIKQIMQSNYVDMTIYLYRYYNQIKKL